MSNDYIAPVLAKLTANAAITLLHRPTDSMNLGRVFTGNGKWTTLAAIGVFNNLRAAGCAEEVYEPDGPFGGRRGPFWHVTSLGVEVAAYLREHWLEVQGTLRSPEKRP